MIASKHDRSRTLPRWLAVAALAGGAVIFATALVATSEVVPSETGALSEILIEHDGDTTVINLLGVSDPVYTAFEREDPRSLVVDLSSVPVGSLEGSLAVGDGVLEEVIVSPFETGSEQNSRVELRLTRAVEYELAAHADRFEVRLTPTVRELPTAREAAEPVSEELAAAESAPVNPDKRPEVENQAPQLAATQLFAVAVEETPNGTIVRLEGNGTMKDVDAFVLEEPDRLVLDLYGVEQSETPARIEVGSPYAARVRVGEHGDKVRVVIDGGGAEEPFATFQTVPERDGLEIRLGSGTGAIAASRPVPTPTITLKEAVEQLKREAARKTQPAEPESAPELTFEPVSPSEEEAAPAAAPEQTAAVTETQSPAAEVEREEEAAVVVAAPPDEAVTPESTMTRVYGVELDSQREMDRVVILTDSPADYELATPSGGTLVVRLFGSQIDPEAAVRLSPAEAGPISLVTAFQQPDVETPEVRVVVAQTPGTVPLVTQQGNTLFLDFLREQAAAAPLPLHTGLARETPPQKTAVEPFASAAAPAPPASIDPEEGMSLLVEGGLREGKQYVGRRISLDFKDVDIADVLRLIADVSDLNIVAGDDVGGKVTIRLVDVPWDQALDVILLTKGLGFVHVGNVLRIAPSGMIQAEEEARLQERRAKEKLEDLVVKLQPVNYADVKELSKMVKRLLTPRGSVDVDLRTNTVILKDIPSVIDEATALVKALDTQTPQVLIEAKIVEARLDFSREIGSTWAFGAQPFTDAFDPQTDRRDLDLGEDFIFHDNSLLTGFTDTFNHVQVANPITSVANGLLDLGAFILDEQFNLELRLEAAESNGDGKVISSPRIVTLDNREAVIEQGVSIPFQTFENGDAQLEFIDAVLKLKVTPHITADRSIIMKIEVERNAPDDSVQTPTGSPAIAKNEAKTETLVKDGQTLVLGGIYVVNKSDRRSGVPFFSNIPLIGAAFRNTEVRDQRNELLIFVTPRIVVSSDAS